MKKNEILINFDKKENHLSDEEKKYISPSSTLDSLYKKVGFRGVVLPYTIQGGGLDNEDFLYLAIDYVARVCWAFHSQNTIDYLKIYKDSFFDFKISKITKEKAFGLLVNYENNHKFKSHGLVDFFGYCSAFYENFNGRNTLYTLLNINTILYFWCDGLEVKKIDNLKSKIAIKYTISEDRKNRTLLNPIKFSLFKGLTFIEHIASLNLIIALALETVKGNEEQTKRYTDVIDFSWNHFINNPNVLNNPEQCCQEVFKIISNETNVSGLWNQNKEIKNWL
jgi:hypothetical protein